MSSIEAIARWWVAFSIIAIVCAPLTWWLADGLGRYRHALLRPVGLVVATLVIWWPASLFGLPFRLESLIVGMAVIGGAGWFVQIRKSTIPTGEIRSILLFEGLWLIGFVGYIAFRSANPDIANTEKPMEIALLNSVVLSDQAPAPDPWFAGSAINYYYFGYQTISTLVHTSGVPTSMAFNLMLASIFASTLSVASSLGGWLAERFGRMHHASIIVSGALAGSFVGLAGNLETAVRLIRSPGDTISAGWWDGIGWQASRVIVDSGINGNPSPSDTINEFPAFSFVLGDLHPHLITLPVLLATIALAASQVGSERKPSLWRSGAIGAFAGLLYASNSWDAPVGVVVVLGAILAFERRLGRSLMERLGVAILGAVAAALPFAISYTAPVGASGSNAPDWLSRIPVIGSLPQTIAIVTWRPSSASELLTVHGIWIVIGLMFAGWVGSTSSDIRATLRSHASILVPVALIMLAAALAWAPAIVLLGIPALAMLAIASRDKRPGVPIVAGLYAAGFGLALIPEFFYIQDSFGNRMNTVFKLNFQAWLFFAIASAVAGVLVVQRTKGSGRLMSITTIVLAVVLASPYAVLSVEDWMDLGVIPGTIDGAAYLDVTNPDEADAIVWLSSQASGGDIIVEAPGCAYQSLNGVPMNRFSAFTGVPTLLGWANHESQWRAGEFSDISAVLGERDVLAASWLNGSPGATPSELAPRFVIFGTIERTGPERCQKLVAHGQQDINALRAVGWETAFESGDTLILARAGDPAIKAE